MRAAGAPHLVSAALMPWERPRAIFVSGGGCPPSPAHRAGEGGAFRPTPKVCGRRASPNARLPCQSRPALPTHLGLISPRRYHYARLHARRWRRRDAPRRPRGRRRRRRRRRLLRRHSRPRSAPCAIASPGQFPLLFGGWVSAAPVTRGDCPVASGGPGPTWGWVTTPPRCQSGRPVDLVRTRGRMCRPLLFDYGNGHWSPTTINLWTERPPVASVMRAESPVCLGARSDRVVRTRV